MTTKKTIQDVKDIIELQIKKAKDEYVAQFGIKEAKWWQKKAICLERDIHVLAWVKIFALEDETYAPKKMKSRTGKIIKLNEPSLKDCDDHFEHIKHLATKDLNFYDLAHKIIHSVIKHERE